MFSIGRKCFIGVMTMWVIQWQGIDTLETFLCTHNLRWELYNKIIWHQGCLVSNQVGEVCKLWEVSTCGASSLIYSKTCQHSILQDTIPTCSQCIEWMKPIAGSKQTRTPTSVDGMTTTWNCWQFDRWEHNNLRAEVGHN